jgi:hypothetical protein
MPPNGQRSGIRDDVLSHFIGLAISRFGATLNSFEAISILPLGLGLYNTRPSQLGRCAVTTEGDRYFSFK